MRNLSIAGRKTVFKTIAIKKIVQLAIVKVIPISVILELDKIKKNLYGKMAILKLTVQPFIIVQLLWKWWFKIHRHFC